MTYYNCLGIDPGLHIIGWAFLQGNSREHPTLIDYGTIETSKELSTPARLSIIETDMTSLIAEFKPNLIGIEMPFFTRQIKAAGGVLQALGVINLVCYRHGQITPLMLHQSSWKGHLGNGRAKKAEVASMVESLFTLSHVTKDDAVDAIGIAYATFCGLRNNI